MSHIDRVTVFPNGTDGVKEFCYYMLAGVFIIRMNNQSGNSELVSVAISTNFMVVKNLEILFASRVSIESLAALCDELKTEKGAERIAKAVIDGIRNNADIGKMVFLSNK